MDDGLLEGLRRLSSSGRMAFQLGVQLVIDSKLVALAPRNSKEVGEAVNTEIVIDNKLLALAPRNSEKVGEAVNTRTENMLSKDKIESTKVYSEADTNSCTESDNDGCSNMWGSYDRDVLASSIKDTSDCSECTSDSADEEDRGTILAPIDCPPEYADGDHIWFISSKVILH